MTDSSLMTSKLSNITLKYLSILRIRGKQFCTQIKRKSVNNIFEIQIFMSFDISQSFHITHDTSIATIKFLTDPNQFSPIEQLDSVTSSVIIPRVLFQSNSSNKKKNLQLQSRIKENSAQKNSKNNNFLTRNKLFPFLQNEQLCQSIEIEGSNSKVIKSLQDEDSNLLSSPKIRQGLSHRMPHMIKLFQDSSIDQIPENSQHNMEIRFQESGKKRQNYNQIIHRGWGYQYANEQVEVLKNNVQKLKKVLDGMGCKIQNTIYQSQDQVQMFQKQFVKSNGLTTCEDRIFRSIQAKSTKSQQIKNQQLYIARVISQFRNDFQANEQQDRNLLSNHKLLNTTPKKSYNTCQNSSRMLMQRKMINSGLKAKQINSA